MTTEFDKATPAQTVTVPIVPTEAMWSGLARDIVMWRDMGQPTGANLYRHLHCLGRDVPVWLRDTIPDIEHVPSKGSVAVAIWRAMVDDSQAVNAFGSGQGDAVAEQYRIRRPRRDDDGWMSMPSGIDRDKIMGRPSLYEVRPLYAHPPAASARIAELEAEVAALKRVEETAHATIRSLETRPSAALAPAERASPERVRHLKRGSTYGVAFRNVEVQTSRPIVEGDVLVVYVADSDGKPWARLPEEFDDGRFEPVDPLVTKEWFERRAGLEEGREIGAGPQQAPTEPASEASARSAAIRECIHALPPSKKRTGFLDDQRDGFNDAVEASVQTLTALLETIPAERAEAAQDGEPMYLIRKGGYFYRPNFCGYTTDVAAAGRYSKEDAEAEATIEPRHMSAVPAPVIPDAAPTRAGALDAAGAIEWQKIEGAPERLAPGSQPLLVRNRTGLLWVWTDAACYTRQTWIDMGAIHYAALAAGDGGEDA